jgi:MmgE/PrpD N-terminal domain
MHKPGRTAKSSAQVTGNFGLTHPGGVVWSSVTAIALECESSVFEAFTAAAFGYELAVRLSEAFGIEHRRRWHATTTAGAVGAAGAAALLFGGMKRRSMTPLATRFRSPADPFRRVSATNPPRR